MCLGIKNPYILLNFSLDLLLLDLYILPFHKYSLVGASLLNKPTNPQMSNEKCIHPSFFLTQICVGEGGGGTFSWLYKQCEIRKKDWQYRERDERGLEKVVLNIVRFFTQLAKI